MRTAGLFITHLRSARIDAHYARLVHDTSADIEWRFVLNPRNYPAPRVDLPYRRAAHSMPRRYQMTLRNGGVVGGYMDTVILPCVIALDADFTWVVEYDVDYSGCWQTLFDRFAGNAADLLTSRLETKLQCPDWYWWRTAGCPPDLPPERMLRGFHPIMRLSRGFAQAYCRLVEDPVWRGHYEFTMPTIAAAEGFGLEDIGGSGAGSDTFRWRPAMDAYFHEDSGRFPLPDTLYHPVKPEVRAASRKPSQLLQIARKVRATCRAGPRADSTAGGSSAG